MNMWSQRMHWHEPCPLPVLGRAMRDGAWVDIRTDEHLWQRVRITEIRVYVRSEDIVVRQEWLDAEGEFRHAQGVIESDAIWTVTPTIHRIGEVQSHLEQPSRTDFENMAQVVAKCAAPPEQSDSTLPPEFLLHPQAKEPWWQTHARHGCVLLLFSISDESPLACCEAFGYRSQMPYQTARDRLRFDITQEGGSWLTQLKALRKLVHVALGSQPSRTGWRGFGALVT